MDRLENTATVVAFVGVIVLIIGLGYDNPSVKFWAVIIFMVCVFICLMLVTSASSKRFTEMMAPRESYYLFTITYDGPFTQAKRSKITTEVSEMMKLLNFLSKRDVKYAVKVEQKYGKK